MQGTGQKARSDETHSAWPAILLPLRDHAMNRPGKLAVKDEQGSLDYQSLCAEIEIQADAFRRGGIGQGDPVLLLLDVCVDSVVAYWALHAIGAVLVVGDPTGTFSNIEHFAKVSGASHILAGQKVGDKIKGLSACKMWRSAGPDRWSVTQAFWGADNGPVTSLGRSAHQLPEHCALILFSSGTTSAPKAIVHKRQAMQALHETLLKTWKLNPDDVVLGALPFHTIYGLIFNAASTIYAGATLVLQKRFHPEHALTAIEEHGVTTSAMVPAMLIMMLNLDGKERFDLSTLRMVYSASAPISQADIDSFTMFADTVVNCNYGMTEIPGAAVEVAGVDHTDGSAGKVSPGFEFSIRGPEGRELPVGETGEIAMRGPTLMAEYLGEPEKTDDRIRDGWIYSQDKGRLDEHGNVFVLGRMSDMIIRGGLNISPLEIEDVLSAHPNVVDVAIIGPEHAVLGQSIRAVVVPTKMPANEDLTTQLLEHCKLELAPPKVPQDFVFIEEIPRNAGGKIDRKALLQSHQDKAATDGGKR